MCYFYFFLILKLDPDDPYKLTGETRALGLTMARGTSVLLLMPTDGTQELLENPFVSSSDDVQID